MSKLIVANWKMNGRQDAVGSFLESVTKEVNKNHLDYQRASLVLCLPYLYLSQVVCKVAQSGIWVGAQNVSQYPDGAYTGEISAEMLSDIGCRYVIVGHSERRAIFGEDSDVIAGKISAAVRVGLTPILCIGESLSERESGLAMSVIKVQLEEVFSRINVDERQQVIFAYEPVWAIGTGKNATVAQVADMHAYIVDVCKAEFGLAEAMVLYGGSVKPGNAAELGRVPHVDGALVGGASLVGPDFLAIAKFMQ